MTETRSCGGSLNDTSGWIGVSYNAALIGLDSFDCLWTITAKQMYKVLLRTLNLQIGWSPNCEDNYLTVCTFTYVLLNWVCIAITYHNITFI